MLSIWGPEDAGSVILIVKNIITIYIERGHPRRFLLSPGDIGEHCEPSASTGEYLTPGIESSAYESQRGFEPWNPVGGAPRSNGDDYSGSNKPGSLIHTDGCNGPTKDYIVDSLLHLKKHSAGNYLFGLYGGEY